MRENMRVYAQKLDKQNEETIVTRLILKLCNSVALRYMTITVMVQMRSDT